MPFLVLRCFRACFVSHYVIPQTGRSALERRRRPCAVHAVCPDEQAVLCSYVGEMHFTRLADVKEKKKEEGCGCFTKVRSLHGHWRYFAPCDLRAHLRIVMHTYAPASVFPSLGTNASARRLRRGSFQQRDTLSERRATTDAAVGPAWRNASRYLAMRVRACHGDSWRGTAVEKSRPVSIHGVLC